MCHALACAAGCCIELFCGGSLHACRPIAHARSLRRAFLNASSSLAPADFAQPSASGGLGGCCLSPGAPAAAPHAGPLPGGAGSSSMSSLPAPFFEINGPLGLELSRGRLMEPLHPLKVGGRVRQHCKRCHWPELYGAPRSKLLSLYLMAARRPQPGTQHGRAAARQLRPPLGPAATRLCALCLPLPAVRAAPCGGRRKRQRGRPCLAARSAARGAAGADAPRPRAPQGRRADGGALQRKPALCSGARLSCHGRHRGSGGRSAHGLGACGELAAALASSPGGPGGAAHLGPAGGRCRAG